MDTLAPQPLEDRKWIAKTVRELRLARGMTQSHLARLLLLSGESRLPPLAGSDPSPLFWFCRFPLFEPGQPPVKTVDLPGQPVRDPLLPLVDHKDEVPGTFIPVRAGCCICR